METRNDLRAEVDRAKLMIRLAIISGILTLVLLVLTLILGVIKMSFAGSDVFSLALLPLTLSFLFSISALLHGALGSAASAEEEEKILLEKRKENKAFNVEEDVRFTAGRTYENFVRFAPYVISVLAILITFGMLWLYYGFWTDRLERVMPANSLHSALVSSILMLVSVFVGAFYIGQSRVTTFRWLRPVGSWLVSAAGIFLLAMISAICNHFEIPSVDTRLAWIIFWLCMVLGVEFVINLVIEFYRPRSLIEVRPIFESRLLALFTEPGGVMRNMADALDYQFGFKVSTTWIYGFIERALFPMLLVWALVLWLSTSIYEVSPEEIGMRERFGKVVSTTPLEPGVYFELPYPFGNIARFSCTRIHQVFVGGKSDSSERGKAPEVSLWTKAHSEKGENEFIVAVEAKSSDNTDQREAVSVALVSLDMPVQYRIRKDQIMDYAYGNRDPEVILRRISEQVTTEYLASCSLMELMAGGRSKATATIRKRIQTIVDQEKLGIEVVGISLLGVHPPVEQVAPAFQEVFGALEKKETMILAAKAYEAQIVPQAQAKALSIEQDAISYRYRTTQVARAEAMRFGSQLTSYLAMPSMFMLGEKLNLLEQEGAGMRKFVLSAGLDNEVYELNFEEKERLDLLDADLGTVQTETN